MMIVSEWKSHSPVWIFATPWTVAHQAPLSMGFSRQEYWSGLPFPSPGDLPNPGIKPRSLALRADSLPVKPQGKPKNTGVGSLSLLQWIFWPGNWTGVSCIAGGFFTNWAMREAQLGYENLIHPVLQDNTMIRYVWRRLRWGCVRRFSSHQRFLDILLLKLPQGT